jgi:hypothetical protein
VELKPPTGSGSGFGLEIWALGTPGELDVAQAALAAAGVVQWAGTGGVRGHRDTLGGADQGRQRAYLRVHIGGVR